MRTRKEALALGEKVYSGGKECIHGHPSYRYTVTGICVYCHRARIKNDKLKMKKAQIDLAHGLIEVCVKIPRDKDLELELFCRALRFDAGIMFEGC